LVLKKLSPLFNGEFVDIGVNLGQTLIKACAIFRQLNYVGFEPNANCVHYVQELIRLNKFPNCHLIPVGIGDSSDILKLNFFYEDESDQSASLLDNFRPDQTIDHFQYVPVFGGAILEKFLPKAVHTLVKIDVEGAELEVLKGLQGWILAFKPIMLMEILPAYTLENKFRVERQLELVSLLQSWDYQMFRIMKGTEISFLPLDDIDIHGNIDDSDYLLCPKGLKQEILDLSSK